jgi:alpha-glucosidase
VAAPPYPDKLDDYAVEFPSDTWYDYWTGRRVRKPNPVDPEPNAPIAAADLIPLTTWIHPDLASLPVFVRAGSILPMAPLLQSTDETPQGPLTLRVYVGDACAGHLYLDDGKTYDYKKGVSLSVDFHCEVTAGGLRITVSKHQGSYPAWWRQIEVQVYGWQPREHTATLDGKDIEFGVSSVPDNVTLTVPDNERGALLELK